MCLDHARDDVHPPSAWSRVLEHGIGLAHARRGADEGLACINRPRLWVTEAESNV